MRKIDRLPIPEVLEKNGEKWTKAFVPTSNKRPSSKTYGHPDIRKDLMLMSSNKCYYCERSVKGEPNEIDHYLEVADFRHLAFVWENLYLGCNNCNKKITHKRLPVTSALDPCFHDDNTIRQHLNFVEEIVDFHTDLGRDTIKKFRLDNKDMDYLRVQELKKFHKVLFQIQKTCMRQHRKKMKPKEVELLQSFTKPNKPFSLMFFCLLRDSNYIE